MPPPPAESRPKCYGCERMVDTRSQRGRRPVAERGATPKVPRWRLKTLGALRSMFTPLLPDDYLELINPLWSTQELRGRIERIEHETADAATILIKPGWEWEGHEPGQYLRIGVVVDGVHHWRAYSLTSDPGRPDGCISITPKLRRVRQGLALPGSRGQARGDRPPRRRGGRLRAPRPAARQVPLHQRRQRHHADHEHAPRAGAPGRARRRGRACTPRAPPRT